MTNEELTAFTEFLNDIESVVTKHGWNIGMYDNLSESDFPSVKITFIPALGYDSQFRKFGYKESGEEKTDGDLISRTDLLKDIAKLKKSPWFNEGKDIKDLFRHNSYVTRKEAVEIIEDLCIKNLPSAEK